MKRREFLNISLPATGAVLLAPGFLNFQLYREIGWQFTGEPTFDEYDLVVNGAGLSGYFAAIRAAQKGLRVLVVEKRSSPGFDIAAKRKLWLGADGLEGFDTELTRLFFPEQERFEVQNPNGTGINNSRFGDELALLAGTVKKGMVRNLLVNKVHLLLMTDACGLFTDGEQVNGVLLACKHGLYSVKCRNFVDATDNLTFTRHLVSENKKIDHVGFVIELLGAIVGSKKVVSAPGIGLLNDQLILRPGKNTDKQAFLYFDYPALDISPDQVEVKSRAIASEIGKNLPKIDPSLAKASIHWYGLESSVYFDGNDLPQVKMKGYFMLPQAIGELSCRKVTELQFAAGQVVENIDRKSTGKSFKSLIIAGAKIPAAQVSFTDPVEPGLAIPLKRCTFPYEKYITDKCTHQVVVAGGGTAGAMAGIAAQERGADTVVVEYFNDYGGTRTMGGVMGYYHGMKENRLLKRMDEDAAKFMAGMNISKKIGQKIFLVDRFIAAGGNHLPGAIIFDTILTNHRVNGIVASCNGKLKVVKGTITVDATGDGDVAAFAGAAYHHGNPRTGKTQNFSQWNISGGGKAPSGATSDYGIIDNTKISELQRGLFLSHYEAHCYDFHPYLTVRESRRVKGLYTLNLIDAAEPTHFEDVISLATSDYDPHYVGNSEFTRAGFLLPHSNVLKVEIPYRSIVPEKLDGLLVSGKAFSQTHDALQFTRMAADISVLGHLTGQVAAHLAIENIEPRSFNIAELQKEWFDMGYIPEEYQARKPGNKANDSEEIARRVRMLSLGNREYLYECARLPHAKAVPVLKEAFAKEQGIPGKLLLAKALAWFGDPVGNDLIEKELVQMFSEEQATGYPQGYVENYDFIRGREKNQLEGLFWLINQSIALLAMSGSTQGMTTIRKILENTTSGGKMITWTGDRADYFNTRIDLRIVPFYNRIMNLCFYAERIPDPQFCAGLEKLLRDEHIAGYKTEEYHLTRWRLYGGNLELYIAAALARCGSKKGYELLLTYMEDIHYNFKAFAVNELKSLTKKDFNFNALAYKTHLDKQSFPRPVVKLVKEIDL